MRFSIREVIRRRYREIVYGRPKVKVLPSTIASLDTAPIFLIGVFRFGTTLLRYGIDSHSQICCPPETPFIRAFADLLQNQDNRLGLEAMGFAEDHVLAISQEWVNYFFQGYATAKEKPRFPAMARVCQVMRQTSITQIGLHVYRRLHTGRSKFRR